MPSSTGMLILAGVALFSFVIIQSYMISNMIEHTHRLILGCLIPTVVIGQLCASRINRQDHNMALTYIVLTVIALVSFLIMQPFIITHLVEQSHRIVLGCLIPVVFFGYLAAYYAGYSGKLSTI